MSALSSGRRVSIAAGLAIALGALMALGAWGGATAAPTTGTPSVQVVPASGGSEQWAFGGHAGVSYSCTTTCGTNSTISSLSVSYYIEWVVIYTATNISATQTEFEVQSAINATLSLSVKGCETTTSPCSPISLSGNLAGLETASGFTNVTSTGSVNLTAGTGSPGPVAAMAVMNAHSTAAFNFSGSFSESVPINGTTESLSASFDLGGNSNAGVSFGTPLGVVPIDPQPGQSWNSSAPFTASGSYTSGYSATLSAMGRTDTENRWTSASVSPAGTLDLNGSDLGAVTLYDNYTTPPTTIDAQIISLDFGTGDFTGTHGWLLVPSGLYSGALGGLSGISLIARQPATTTALTSGESADYKSGVGFVGESAQSNATSLGVSSSGAALNLQAGPEPVSVADQQLSAITSTSSGASFPWAALVVTLVVVLAVVVAALLIMRSRRKRAPPAQWAPPAAASEPPTAPPTQ